MEKITLYEQYELIERNETEVNGVWKGAHLILFFLAFVFGSFCTFCFHMLMYLFDEKCVLFPKLLSLVSFRQNVIFEFMPYEKEEADMLPVDFVNTHWIDKSACYLPTYVPLVSGIFGLVWTTMFLMCSTGSRVLTGLQKPWRVLPPVFLFSLAMGCLCAYTSAVTHYGLRELCQKLADITGGTSCSFTVNVATLAYERRIRGVYQAVKLTIVTAWLHTSCWLLSALLAVARVVLAVDFQLVKISANLKGNIDRILECQERQIGTVSPVYTLLVDSKTSTKANLHRNTIRPLDNQKKIRQITNDHGELLHMSTTNEYISGQSLVFDEREKLDRMSAYSAVPKKYKFIVKWLHDLVGAITLPSTGGDKNKISTASLFESQILARQYGQQRLASKLVKNKSSERQQDTRESVIDNEEANVLAHEIKSNIQLQKQRRKDTAEHIQEKKLERNEKLNDLSNEEPTTSRHIDHVVDKRKSNLKQNVMPGEGKTKRAQIDSKTNIFQSRSHDSILSHKKDKTTQTEKEKQE